ncbi:MAG: MFS transporter [Deltaproteobacteria bacterium]|nr:MFS transporter [Deltaproteobacteria bacterium]
MRATLAIGSVAVFVVSLDGTALFVAFPAIRADFADTTIEQLSWVLNAYTVVFGALLVTAGRLADQLGRRRTFMFGLVAFGASSLTCALAPSAWSLVVARAFQGVGAAALIPSSLALALAAGRAEERSLIAALWAAAGALAAAVGPSLGALLVDAFGWRSIFLVNVPVTLIAAARVRKHVTESRDTSLAEWPRVGSSLALVGGSAMLGLGVVEGRAWGAGTSALLAAIGLASLATFALIEARSRAPSFDLSLLSLRAVMTWAGRRREGGQGRRRPYRGPPCAPAMMSRGADFHARSAASACSCPTALRPKTRPSTRSKNASVRSPSDLAARVAQTANSSL